jgi:hypothetical protein
MKKNAIWRKLIKTLLWTTGVRSNLFEGISKESYAKGAIKKQFLYNKGYANSDLSEIFSNNRSDNVADLSCFETSSCWFENIGNGKFITHVLPVEAQFAPINAIICNDFNNDGIIDLLVAGPNIEPNQ